MNSKIKYSGQFMENQIQKGTAEYPNGTKYVGEFKFNKPNGVGTLEYSSGGKFTGNFVDGFEFGEGLCIKPNGTSIKCVMLKKDSYLGDNKYKIFFEKKFTTQQNNFTDPENELKNIFIKMAQDECSVTDSFKILEQKIDIIELDLNPAFAGIDGKNVNVILGIKGIINCVWNN